MPSSSLSSSVGPPIKSPNVPASSTSATKIPSATPAPNAPDPNVTALPVFVSCGAVFLAIFLPITSVAFLPACVPRLISRPLCDAAIPALAILDAALAAKPAGTPMLIISSTILPAAVASAASSKGLISAKYFLPLQPCLYH